MLLLVEDDANTRAVMLQLLEGSGYRVRSAGTGRAALGLFRERAPEIVLLDLGLPDQDGVSVVRAMQAENAQVPIVVVSVVTSESRILEALRAGALGYL